MTNTESFSTPETATIPAAGSGAMLHGDAPGPPPPGLLVGASLFLDVDGTLVDLAERPDLVRVSPMLPDLLARLATRLDGRVALVSGRGAEEVAALIGDPGLTIAGSHGAEIRSGSGQISARPRPPVLDEALAVIDAFAACHPGLLVEDKPQGVALHYRRRPEAAQACQTLAADLARRLGLHRQPGKMVVELLPAGHDKGTAVRRLMEQPAMAGTRPVFIGDDHTDEAGFRAVAAMGGAGILVGSVRETTAIHRLPTVASVHAWLDKEVTA